MVSGILILSDEDKHKYFSKEYLLAEIEVLKNEIETYKELIRLRENKIKELEIRI